MSISWCHDIIFLRVINISESFIFFCDAVTDAAKLATTEVSSTLSQTGFEIVMPVELKAELSIILRDVDIMI